MNSMSLINKASRFEVAGFALVMIGLTLPGIARAQQADAKPAVARPPSKAPPSAGIDRLKCQDLDNSEKLVREEIMKRIREAQRSGFKPALSYEDGRTNAPEAVRLDARAKDQAAAVASALFAAVKNPANAANVASQRLNNSADRRASFTMNVRCAGQDGPTPRKILENTTRFFGGRACADGSTPIDLGLNSRQVWQTDLSTEKVMVRFARAKITSTDDNKVAVCRGSREECGTNAPYETISLPNFTPTMGREYYFEDATYFNVGMGFKVSMTNRSAVKVAPIEVCGVKVYLVSSINSNYDVAYQKGFDRGTLLGLIAPVGGKTLVIGDVSMQTSTPGSYTLKMAEHQDKVMNSVLHEGYQSIADTIGATERPVLGALPGGQQRGSPPSGVVSRRSVANQ